MIGRRGLFSAAGLLLAASPAAPLAATSSRAKAAAARWVGR